MRPEERREEERKGEERRREMRQAEMIKRRGEDVRPEKRELTRKEKCK